MLMRGSAASVLNTGLNVRFCVRVLCSRKISFKNVFSSLFNVVWKVTCEVSGSEYPGIFNPLAPEFFFLILAHPVYKM